MRFGRIQGRLYGPGKKVGGSVGAAASSKRVLTDEELSGGLSAEDVGVSLDHRHETPGIHKFGSRASICVPTSGLLHGAGQLSVSRDQALGSTS